jgi:hypothetical protein
MVVCLAVLTVIGLWPWQATTAVDCFRVVVWEIIVAAVLLVGAIFLGVGLLGGELQKVAEGLVASENAVRHNAR